MGRGPVLARALPVRDVPLARLRARARRARRVLRRAARRAARAAHVLRRERAARAANAIDSLCAVFDAVRLAAELVNAYAKRASSTAACSWARFLRALRLLNSGPVLLLVRGRRKAGELQRELFEQVRAVQKRSADALELRVGRCTLRARSVQRHRSARAVGATSPEDRRPARTARSCSTGAACSSSTASRSATATRRRAPTSARARSRRGSTSPSRRSPCTSRTARARASRACGRSRSRSRWSSRAARRPRAHRRQRRRVRARRVRRRRGRAREGARGALAARAGPHRRERGRALASASGARARDASLASVAHGWVARALLCEPPVSREQLRALLLANLESADSAALALDEVPDAGAFRAALLGDEERQKLEMRSARKAVAAATGMHHVFSKGNERAQGAERVEQTRAAEAAEQAEAANAADAADAPEAPEKLESAAVLKDVISVKTRRAS